MDIQEEYAQRLREKRRFQTGKLKKVELFWRIDWRGTNIIFLKKPNDLLYLYIVQEDFGKSTNSKIDVV